MEKRQWAALCLAGCLMLGLGACGSQTEQGSGSSAGSAGASTPTGFGSGAESASSQGQDALAEYTVEGVGTFQLPQGFAQETGEISLLAYIGSREDRQAAQPVMALAELAFSDLDLTCQEAQARYGALSRYCFPRDYYPEVAREEHTLELWSAHFSGSYGQMWVYYSQAGYDETGAPRTGSSRIPALWYLEQTRDGAWEVVGIKEHP